MAHFCPGAIGQKLVLLGQRQGLSSRRGLRDLGLGRVRRELFPNRVPQGQAQEQHPARVSWIVAMV